MKLNYLGRVQVWLVKNIMNFFKQQPKPDNYDNWEVFNHENYVDGDLVKKREIRYRSSRAAYAIESDPQAQWMEKLFATSINLTDLQGKTLLDLGCFTGGRLIAYLEKYKLGYGYGIDINPIFAIAGTEFAKSKGLADRVEFTTGFGENLPYESNSMDYVVSTDVFEHVRDLPKVLHECHRILKPGGKLLCTFPQFYQPLEAHLGLVTSAFPLHWFFPGKIISEAYFQILSERGEEAKWYAGEARSLATWEKLPTLNGITVSAFKKLVSGTDWCAQWKKRPILTTGRRSTQLKFRVISKLFTPLCRLPIFEEFFLDRITVILEKRGFQINDLNQ